MLIEESMKRMQYDFDEIIDRTRTSSIKLEAGEKKNPYLPKDAIPLWVADMMCLRPR
jgi:bifunctional pyridoxal-dependent enzyme with beta-cystathionase and maltose regulon repressor activities